MSYPMDSLTKGGGLRYKDGIAGEVVTTYQVVYAAGDGRWYLADADVASSAPLVGLTVDPAIIGQKSRILIKGIIQNLSWTWTPGQEIYLSQVAGGMTQTAPILPARTQVVGAAITANVIWFEVEGAGLGGGATGCGILEGATAYVGFDACKEPYTNYWLCDGTADEVQINAAITYAVGQGGGIIQLEEGNYTLADRVNLGSNCHLRGEGVGTVVTIINAFPNTSLFRFNTDVTYSEISHLKITGNGANQTVRLWAVYNNDGDDIRIHDLFITDNHGDSIHSDDGVRVRIYNNKITSPNAGLASVYSPHIMCIGDTDLWITDNLCDSTLPTIERNDNSIHMEHCSNVHVLRNKIYRASDTGIEIEGVGGDSTIVEVSNNIIAHTGNFGIDIDNGVSDVTVDNNIITDYGENGANFAGIYVFSESDGGVERLKISNNQFVDPDAASHFCIIFNTTATGATADVIRWVTINGNSGGNGGAGAISVLGATYAQRQIDEVYIYGNIWNNDAVVNLDAINNLHVSEPSSATAYVGFDGNLRHLPNYWYANGTADDVQIQAAIDYVGGLGGGIVHLERGNYDITATVVDSGYDNIILEGEGEDTLLTLANGSDVQIIYLTSVSGWTLRDFKFDGNKANQTAWAAHAIHLDTVDQFRIIGVSGLAACSTNIYLEGCSNGLIEPILLTTAYDDNLSIEQASHDITVIGGEYSYASGGGNSNGIELSDGCYQITVTAPWCHHNDSSGINVSASASEDPARDITIIRPHCHDNTVHGITLFTANGANAAVYNVSVDHPNCHDNTAAGIRITTDVASGLTTYGIAMEAIISIDNGDYGIRGERCRDVFLDAIDLTGNTTAPINRGAGALFTLGTHVRAIPSYFMPFGDRNWQTLNTAGRVYLCPIQIDEGVVASVIAYAVGAVVIGNVYVGIYRDNGLTPAGGALMATSGSVAVGAGTYQAKMVDITDVWLPPGLYWLAIESDETTLVVGKGDNEPATVGGLGTYLAKGYYDRAGGYGALTDPCPATTYATNTPDWLWINLA